MYRVGCFFVAAKQNLGLPILNSILSSESWELSAHTIPELYIEIDAALSLSDSFTSSANNTLKIIDKNLPATYEQECVKLGKNAVLIDEHNRPLVFRGERLNRLIYNKCYLASLLANIGSIDDMKVIEVGASDGLFAKLLKANGARYVYGVDTEPLCGISYRNESMLEFASGHSSLLPADDCSFDLSVSIASFEHISDPIKALNEMIRVTRPGGYVYIQAGPLYYSPNGHHMFDYFRSEPWAHLRFTPEELVQMLKTRGFEETIQKEFMITAEEYIDLMLSKKHLNGLKLSQYGLREYCNGNNTRLVKFTPSYECADQLTSAIASQLNHISRNNLLLHGFELILKKDYSA